jgi:predicted permease
MRGRFLLDVRYAFRYLRRNPGFAAVAVAVLAVGIGVNTAVFGLLDALLFKPLALRDPQELVRVAGVGTDGAISYADLVSFRTARTLRGLTGFTADSLTLRVDGEVAHERAGAYLVADDYFDVLGVLPEVGTTSIEGRDGVPGIVLSDRYWRRRFGGRADVLGRSVWIAGRDFAVVGVAPPDFTGTMRGGNPELYVPYAATVPRELLEVRERRSLIAVGRLAPSATVAAVQAELTLIAQRLSRNRSEAAGQVAVSVFPESTALFRELPPLRFTVFAVMGMFALLLLVACVNLAGLLTARGTFRRQEIAIRSMQGASGSAIVAQLLTESAVIALLGGATGLVVGAGARNLLWRELQSSVVALTGVDSFWIDTRVDARVLIFTSLVSLVAALVFGALPAFHATRQDLYTHAKASPSTPTPSHLVHLRRIVSVQVAFSSVLLACAGLLVQTVRSAATADLGYPLDRMYGADLDLSSVADGQRPQALDDVLGSVRGMPGVEAAALMGYGGPGYLPESATPGRSQNYVLAFPSSGYFQTVRIPVLAGREFEASDDDASARVAIVNERLAEALWPGESAVGRQLPWRRNEPPLSVVGVVKTVRSFPVGPPFFEIYIPLGQQNLSRLTLHVRTAPGGETALAARLFEQLRHAASGVAMTRVVSRREWATSLLAVPRALVKVLGSLGAAALFLAAIGLYGITAYAAARRAPECAVRRALGASRGSVLWLLVRGSARPIVAGLAAGCVFSVMAGWILKAALLGSTFDALALVVAPAVLTATAGLAIAWPALRAASVDPMRLLRED